MADIQALYDKPGATSYYNLSRKDVFNVLQKYVQQNGLQPENALEIGCSGGGTGTLIKEQLGVNYYAGLELMPPAVEVAKNRLDWVEQGNIEDLIAHNQLDRIPHKQYDLLLFLDVLEHLYNPWAVLRETSKLLRPGGLLVGSIPNMGNLYVLWKIMRDQFEYEEEGLLDRTHIRWFTAHTIKNMVSENFVLKEMATNHDTWKSMNWQQKFFQVATLGQWKRLFIRQYIFIAQVK